MDHVDPGGAGALLTLLHTNDLHGRVEAIARIATLIERLRAEEPDRTFLYVDAGDVEETTTRISNVTKGAAMHRLLAAAGCRVAAVGNAAWLRYGPQVLPDHARAAGYPLLLANLRTPDGAQLPGTRPSVVVEAAGVGVGFMGVSATMEALFPGFDMGVSFVPAADAVREEASRLRAAGAELVVVLSHLGLDVPPEREDDRRLAAAVQGEVDLVIGAHSHDLLERGEWIGDVLVAQAGEYGQHLGRVDVGDGRPRASVLEVSGDLPLHPAVTAAAAAVEPEVAGILAEPIGVLDRPLDPQWVAEMLRERMDAEVGLVVANQVLQGTLPAGPVLRGELWEVCESSANPGVTAMTGAQLAELIERGRDPAFMDERPRPLRGRPRGYLHVSGPAELDPARTYAVAGTDYELEPYGGLVPAEWALQVRYDFPVIVREAIEEHLGSYPSSSS